LIDAYNNAGLADFGLAALIDPDMPLSETVEAITPAYAPPEVFAKKPLTEYADVYSLAATLYAVLSGHPPRWSETVETPSIPEIMKRQRLPIKSIPGVDKGFMEVLLNAMAEDPEDRPTAAQFRDQLKALDLSTQLAPKPLTTAEGSRESAPTPHPEEPAAKVAKAAASPVPASRSPNRWERRGVVTLIVVAVLIVVASAIAVINLAGRTPAVEPSPSLSATSNVPETPSRYTCCGPRRLHRLLRAARRGRLLRISTGMLGHGERSRRCPVARGSAGMQQDPRLSDLHCGTDDL
jgi:serine/threonine protein kinase